MESVVLTAKLAPPTVPIVGTIIIILGASASFILLSLRILEHINYYSITSQQKCQIRILFLLVGLNIIPIIDYHLMFYHTIFQFIQTIIECSILVQLINFLIQIIKDQQPKDSPNLSNYLDHEYINPPIWAQLATWFQYKKPIKMPFPFHNVYQRPGKQRFFFWTLTFIFQYPILRILLSFIQFILAFNQTSFYSNQYLIKNSITFAFNWINLISLFICFYFSSLFFSVIHSDLMFPLVGASINPSTHFCATFTFLFATSVQAILLAVINALHPIEVMPALDGTSDAIVLNALLMSVEVAIFTIIAVIGLRVIDKGIPPYFRGGFQYPPWYVAILNISNIFKDGNFEKLKISDKFVHKSASSERLHYTFRDDLKVPTTLDGSLARPQSVKFPGRFKPSSGEKVGTIEYIE